MSFDIGNIGKLANAAKEIQQEVTSGEAGGLAKNVLQGLQHSEQLGGLAEKATEQVIPLLKNLLGQAQGLLKTAPGNQDALDSCVKQGLALLAKKEVNTTAVTKLTAELSELIQKASPAADGKTDDKPSRAIPAPATGKSAPAAAESTKTSTVVAFTDVAKDSYCYNAVQWAVANGIASGTSDTTFGVEDACTRAQTLTLMWRASGSPAPRLAKSPFTDVPKDAYYHDAVLWAIEAGITAGASGNVFHPNDTITRGQVVTFLYRHAGAPDVDLTDEFQDVPADAYYAKAVAWAVSKGITSGMGEHTFRPDTVCTRGQIVTFLYRAR